MPTFDALEAPIFALEATDITALQLRSALSDDDGETHAAIAQSKAPPVQQRHKASKRQDVRPDALQVLTVMAQNRLLPKSAWGMCRSMHRKLEGRFDADPLVALSLSPPAPGAGARDRFDGLFEDVKAMTLCGMQGTLTRVPCSLQELHLLACNPMEMLPLLRTALRLTDSGPQSDVLTLVRRLPDSVGDLRALTALDLRACTRLTLYQTLSATSKL
ncbi:hypothetical protein JKP88DRAFT_244449 [Tribonema minus]|uniref:Uncharacterized protein n=1 Tax=Tribonema minus TaxID=303371 RepID=A0A835Z149_9STRA|nr:hypothetical protein JKP88DRAFT_244449 [Tribonema minus]